MRGARYLQARLRERSLRSRRDLQLSAKRNIDELKVDVISQHRCDNASSRIMRRGFSAMTFRIIELHGFRN